MPERCFAFGFHQAFRKGETRIKVRAARVEPAEEADASRLPVLTVAMGSTNFHGVELKIVGEPIVIDHTDYRTYEFRVRMENVSVPNTGPLNDKNSAVVAAWNSAKAIKDEKRPAAAEDRVDRVRESVFRDLAAADAHEHPVRQGRARRGGVCPRSRAPLRRPRLSRPDRPRRARSAHELLDEGAGKHRYAGRQPARNARRRFELRRAFSVCPRAAPAGRRNG